MARARLLVVALSAIITTTSAIAQSPTLTITGTNASRSYTQEALLANPAIRSITVTDPVYRRPMTYRAIPLPALLKGTGIGADDYLQARAIDDFSVSIPGSLATANSAQIEGFLAVETPAAPWPSIPGKPDKASAGPFYIVWRLVPPARVSSEYWAYRLTALAVTESPLKRWPGLAVGADVPAGDPVRIGLDRFMALCMACHRFNGDGEGDQGPDLGRPMNPVDYLQPAALRKMIRNPASVRKWPDQKMPGFAEDTLSNSDLDAIIAWLTYKARQPR